MKNKIIISLLSLGALLSFSSCQKQGGETLLPGANLSFTLRVDGQALTKTSGSPAAADESESKITTLDLYLIKKTDTSEVIHISSSDEISEGKPRLTWTAGSDGSYEVRAILPDEYLKEEAPVDYLLYVVANKPDWMTISTYGDLRGSFSNISSADLAACWAENKFLMVNKQDDITDDSKDQAGVSITLPPAADRVNVTIERLATKILVRNNFNMNVAPLLTEVLCSGENPGDPDIKGAIAAMSIEDYALFNAVNSFNLIQQWAAGTGSGDTEKLLVSPSSATAYDISGYYDNVPSSLVFSELETPMYCMENNSPYYEALVDPSGDATPGTKMKGRVTGLVFKARAGYAKSFSGNVSIEEPLNVDNEYSEIDWTKSAAGTTKAENGTGDIIYGTLYQYKGNYYGDIPCLLRNNTALRNALGTDSPSVEQLRAKNVKVYEDGYMYYNYWIEDQNYTDIGNYYLSVMRNTFYDITITAINSLGDEFPCGGYTNTDPISVQVPKLSVSIDIPDWENKTGNYTIR